MLLQLFRNQMTGLEKYVEGEEDSDSDFDDGSSSEDDRVWLQIGWGFFHIINNLLILHFSTN